MYSQNWAIEYHPDDADNNTVCVGITGICESEARRRLAEAGFSGCGVEFRIFETPLVGAVFTRCHLVRVAPGTAVLGGDGEMAGTRNRAVIGAAIGGIGHSSPARRFALTVAHLFNRVRMASLVCSSTG